MPGIAEAPSSIEFRSSASRWEAGVYLVVGGWLVYYVVSKGGSTGLIVGMALGIVFLLATLGKAMAEPDRSVHLAFDAEGLLAPHIFERKLPWASIQAFSFENDPESPSTLFVDMVDPNHYGPKQTGPLETWPVSYRGFRILIGQLECTRDEIEDAFRRFAPQVPRT